MGSGQAALKIDVRSVSSRNIVELYVLSAALEPIISIIAVVVALIPAQGLFALLGINWNTGLSLASLDIVIFVMYLRDC